MELGLYTFGDIHPDPTSGATVSPAQRLREILERIPDMQLAGDVQMLRSNFIGGVKHMPVTYTPSVRKNPAPLVTA